MELKITRIGNSLGVILPRELLIRLGLDKGDSLFVSETPEGFTASPFDPAFAAQMETARNLMKSRRNALRELAKTE
jgi:putative addiction module antidote